METEILFHRIKKSTNIEGHTVCCIQIYIYNDEVKNIIKLYLVFTDYCINQTHKSNYKMSC